MNRIFGSTQNTRFLPDGSNRYIRSDVPLSVREEERTWLLDQNVKTIVDLRTEDESQRRPCPLREDARFCYRNLPVTGGNRVPATPAGVAESYIAMVDGQMEQILDVILNAGTGVLYFCTAGKDRTGVVSALLLHRLGLSDELIVEDYLRSAKCLSAMLLEYAREHPEVDPCVIVPQAEYMRTFLNWLKERDAWQSYHP